MTSLLINCSCDDGIVIESNDAGHGMIERLCPDCGGDGVLELDEFHGQEFEIEDSLPSTMQG